MYVCVCMYVCMYVCMHAKERGLGHLEPSSSPVEDHAEEVISRNVCGNHFHRYLRTSFCRHLLKSVTEVFAEIFSKKHWTQTPGKKLLRGFSPFSSVEILSRSFCGAHLQKYLWNSSAKSSWQSFQAIFVETILIPKKTCGTHL